MLFDRPSVDARAGQVLHEAVDGRSTKKYLVARGRPNLFAQEADSGASPSVAAQSCAGVYANRAKRPPTDD